MGRLKDGSKAEIKRGNFMVGNSVSNEGKKPAVTVRNVIRWLLFLCVVLFFCPSFFVSCSGKDVNVSAMTAVKGVSMYGDQVVDPHPVMLVCLLLPVAALALLYLKKFSDQATAGLAAACMIVDFIVWLVFRSAVKKIADENYCDFRTSAWYALNLAAQLVIIFLSALAAVRKMEMEMDVVSFFASGGAREALDRISVAAGGMPKQAPGPDVICPACGNPIAHGCKFCTSCGAPAPEKALAEESEGEMKPDKCFCKNCGAKLADDAFFCENCGRKVN